MEFVSMCHPQGLLEGFLQNFISKDFSLYFKESEKELVEFSKYSNSKLASTYLPQSMFYPKHLVTFLMSTFV